MTDWRPSESDMEWMRRVLGLIKVGGIWGTSYAIYKKTGEKEMTLIQMECSAPNMTEDVERTEIAIKAIGWDYKVNLGDT